MDPLALLVYRQLVINLHLDAPEVTLVQVSAAHSSGGVAATMAAQLDYNVFERDWIIRNTTLN
jgi:hypothetical protein